ncbi:MAG: PEP-CTERM sorting domain-containing protein, partial [Verrucomicrobiota bacterium]
SVRASLIYSADFSTAGQGWVHNSFFLFGSRPLPGPQSIVGGSNGAAEGRWTASYDSTPSTDFTLFNRFITAGGVMRIEDWGGEARLESFDIDVSQIDLVDISGVNAVLGNGADQFGEYFDFYYRLDGGSAIRQDFSSGGSYAITGLDTSGASTLSVGFEFNVNGSNGFFNPDGWVVGSLTVNNAVPEPSTVISLVLVSLFGGWYYRRRLGNSKKEADEA